MPAISIPSPDEKDLKDALGAWNPGGKKKLNDRYKSSALSSDGKTDLVIVDASRADLRTAEPHVAIPVITLNCWVHGTDLKTVFPVKISSAKLVGTLKRVIRDEQGREFLSMPQGEDYSLETVHDLVLVPENFLSPLDRLSDVFTDPPPGRIHVLVSRPPPSDTRITLPQTRKDDDIMTMLIECKTLVALSELFIDAIQTAYKRTIMSKSLTPSQAAKSKGYLEVQSGDQRILDCRCAEDQPMNTVAPPIQLFNSAFAFFSSKASDPEYNVPDSVVYDVRNFMAQSAQIYDKEDHRGWLRSSLAKLINRPFVSLNSADKMSPDLLSIGRCGPLQTYLVVVEDENEFGGGSDPFIQVALSFQHIFCQEENAELRLRCCCPAFAIAHAGPWLTIMGCIITGHCSVQPLTDLLWIPVHSAHDDNQFLRIARVFYALRESVQRLDSWYEDIVKEVKPFDESSPPHPRFFPSPNAYRNDDDSLVQFAYQTPLEPDVSCVTYRAKTLGENQRDIVVKFVTSYGADAHRHMASAGLAPRLLYCGQIDVVPDMPSYGNLRMVVMEYVNGLPLNKAIELHKVPRSFKSDLQKVFQHLHDAGYVFGDLRQPNVMITHEEKVQLIDFDWVGKGGEVKYPATIPSSITWPTGVQGLVPIRKEHDVEMLNALLTSM